MCGKCCSQAQQIAFCPAEGALSPVHEAVVAVDADGGDIEDLIRLHIRLADERRAVSWDRMSLCFADRGEWRLVQQVDCCNGLAAAGVLGTVGQGHCSYVEEVVGGLACLGERERRRWSRTRYSHQKCGLFADVHKLDCSPEPIRSLAMNDSSLDGRGRPDPDGPAEVQNG